MHARQLDRQITVRRATFSDPAGAVAPVATWADYARVNANVAPVSDGERARAGETLSSMKSRFTVRWSPLLASVDPRDRIFYGGRVYDINGVKEVDRRRFIEITATASAEAP